MAETTQQDERVTLAVLRRDVQALSELITETLRRVDKFIEDNQQAARDQAARMESLSTRLVTIETRTGDVEGLRKQVTTLDTEMQDIRVIKQAALAQIVGLLLVAGLAVAALLR